MAPYLGSELTLLEEILEVFGQRSFPTQAVLCAGMDKSSRACVKEVTLKSGDLQPAIPLIADDWKPVEGELRANLVGHAGEDGHIEKRYRMAMESELTQRAIIGDGLHGAHGIVPLGSINHAARATGIVRQKMFEVAFSGDVPGDEGLIVFFDGVLAELSPKIIVKRLRFGHEDKTTRIPIDAVEEAAGKGAIPYPLKTRIARQQGVGECVGLIGGIGLAIHSRGL